MSRTNKKSSNQKTRRRVTRDLPAPAAKTGKSVKGGYSTGGVLVALGDGSVRLGDGSVRNIKTDISSGNNSVT